MKKKIILFITIILTLIIVLVGFSLYKVLKKPDYNLKEYPIDKLPTFSFSIAGSELQPINITKDELKSRNIKAYKFSKDIDNNWKKVTNIYIGIRLKDILDMYKLEYKDIEIYETNKYSVKFKNDEINEDIFIIFYRDGKRLGELEHISLVSFKDKWNKSLTDFNYIFLYQEETLVDDSSKYEQPTDDEDIYAP